MWLLAVLVRRVFRVFLAILRGVRDTFLWIGRCGKEELFGRNSVWTGKKQPRPLLGLILALTPICALVVVGRPEWFLNTPVMICGAVVMMVLIHGPLRTAPSFLRKLAEMGVSTLLTVSIWITITWKPIWNSMGPDGHRILTVVLVAICCIAWPVSLLWIARSKREREAVALARGSATLAKEVPAQQRPVRIPRTRYADVGGMEEAKETIRRAVQAKLHPEKQYGEVRNGILLYGPQGTGKSLLAEATAGEFGLNFEKVWAHALLNRFIGATGEKIREVFASAALRRPVLFFVDEIDSLGAGRQTGEDSGGASREFNNITMALMGCIDEYRKLDGFILMAATNRLDAVDPALIRPKRFDIKVRVDLPDQATRLKILEAQLAGKPWTGFPLEPFAHLTPGMSASKLTALVDEAAAIAAEQRRKIEEKDLHVAMARDGGKDRPLSKEVNWNDVVIDDSVEEDLRGLVRLLEDPGRTRDLGLKVPTGLLLVGPSGTGKTSIALLIAWQTKRSFYPLTTADVLGAHTGDSVKRIAQVFARAKEHNPSLIFLDEMDGLLPASQFNVSQHDVQVVEQFLTESSSLEAEHNVFLVGTTNHLENIDPRVLRGGRFTEKIQINPPGPANREKLLRRYLEGVTLEAGTDFKQVVDRLDGMAPADLEAICETAKRMAFNRAGNGPKLPPLTSADFARAVDRVLGETVQADRIGLR